MTEYPHIPEDVLLRLAEAGRPSLSLLNCWCAMREGQDVPSRRNFDPTLLGRYLAKVYLYAFDEARGDFVCRLAGEEVNEAWGGSIKGRAFREVVGDDHHAAALARWRAIIETPLVQFGVMEDEVGRDRRRVGERLVTPVRDENGATLMILGLGDYIVRQNDRTWISPVWNRIVRIPCAEIGHVGTDRT